MGRLPRWWRWEGKPCFYRGLLWRAGLTAILLLPVLSPLPGGMARGVTLTIACSAVGIEYRLCREGAQAWAEASGHSVRLIQSPNLSNDRLGLYQQMLAARSTEVDLFQIDIIWPGILGAHFIDLRPYLPPGEAGAHFPAIIRANTVGGELKALPWYTDVGLLFFRKDLLKKYSRETPRTWSELNATAVHIVREERKLGNNRLYGFVFQAKSYEGLTCNALEWIASFGGGRILSPDGKIALHNPRAVKALNTAASWIGSIAPRGVLTYAEEEARGVFQSGRAVFMRNWPYAWSLSQAPDSPVKGKVGVAPLPGGGKQGARVGTLGGWNLAVSKYSRHPRLAAALALYLTSAREQTRRAIAGAYNPTRPAVYRDAKVLAANPFFAFLPAILANAVSRPSEVAGVKYNRVSSIFWEAVHDVLSGRDTAETALEAAERRLRRISRDGRW